jgi:hypothetical protein
MQPLQCIVLSGQHVEPLVRPILPALADVDDAHADAPACDAHRATIGRTRAGIKLSLLKCT